MIDFGASLLETNHLLKCVIIAYTTYYLNPFLSTGALSVISFGWVCRNNKGSLFDATGFDIFYFDYFEVEGRPGVH